MQDDPLPVLPVDDLPSRAEFEKRSQEDLFGEIWGYSAVRENGDLVKAYVMYDRSQDKLALAFYFEDSTGERLRDSTSQTQDFFVFDLLATHGPQPRLVVLAERFNLWCVKFPDYEDPYSFGGNCSRGQVTTKETDDGWAVYVTFAPRFEDPATELLTARWLYVDARESANDESGYESATFRYPPSPYFRTPLRVIQDDPVAGLSVNSGSITAGDFFYTPTEILTRGLLTNAFRCADDTLDADLHEHDDAAHVVTSIDFAMRERTVIPGTSGNGGGGSIFAQPDRTNPDAIFLLDPKGLEDGFHTIGGASDMAGPGEYGTKYATRTEGQVTPVAATQRITLCTIHLLYDAPSRVLSILGSVRDSTRHWADGIEIFVDKDGEGGASLDGDVRILVDRNNFGGLGYGSDAGWIMTDGSEKNAGSRIDVVENGYKFLVRVPDTEPDFKIAIEHTDYDFDNLKKRWIPHGAFLTIPDSWSAIKGPLQSREVLESYESVPGEILIETDYMINLIMVGDEWSDHFQDSVRQGLAKEHAPGILRGLHLAGIKYNYEYEFISASQRESERVFEFMEENSERVTPFYGEMHEDEPWGIAQWIVYDHPEYIDTAFSRYDAEYRLVDAEAFEAFLYETLVEPRSDAADGPSASLIFIAGDPDRIPFLHNYFLAKEDPSTVKRHVAVGLMGYGGNYDMYYFDLYAYPWDPIAGLPGFYDAEKKSAYANYHDLDTAKARIDLITNYVNNATSVLIAPSYLYAPTYAREYLLDLTIATSSHSTALTSTINRFVDKEKIVSELEGLIPHSSWEVRMSLDKINSWSMPSGLRDALIHTKKVPAFAGGSSYMIDVIDSTLLTRELVDWAMWRTQSAHGGFSDVTKSHRVIPVLIVVGERGSATYIDDYGVVGLAPSHPDDETLPCCAIGVTSDGIVWDDKIGFTDLVLHEVGHTLGLMHPFVGYDEDYSLFRNDYFNWYGSAMGYNSPQHGCGFWYSELVDKICGNGDAAFTEFEKESMARAISAYLLRASSSNVYRTLISLETSGTSPDLIPDDLSRLISIVEGNFTKAAAEFQLGNLDAKDGAMHYALHAAAASEILAHRAGIEYARVVPAPEISMPFWVKDQLTRWAQGHASDGEFLDVIDVLIKERIMTGPPDDQGGSIPVGSVPDWITRIIHWWANDRISDLEFVSALQFLINEGILKI